MLQYCVYDPHSTTVRVCPRRHAGLGVPCADNAFVFEPVVACELGLCPKFYGGSVHATIIVKVYPEVKKVTYMESLLIDMARRSYIGTIQNHQVR